MKSSPYVILNLTQHTIVFHLSLFNGNLSKKGKNNETRVLADVFACAFSPQTEVTSPTDSEDRTPGRLQAVWPPPKPKDEEEKVGLKYTEAGKNLKLVILDTVVCIRPGMLTEDQASQAYTDTPHTDWLCG